jgi:hypothetical protein
MEDHAERWQMLCEQAATEQDSERLMALIKEITRLLDEKNRRTQKPLGLGKAA